MMQHKKLLVTQKTTMKRRVLYILTALVLCLNAGAQGQLYVCHHDSCDAYETAHINSITFSYDSIHIDCQPPYAIPQVDSIVFVKPRSLHMEERGWWGDMTEGEVRFLTVLTDSTYRFNYHVRFTITAHDGFCQTAFCELAFDDAGQCKLFREQRYTDASTNDPYIYVKGTLTGPRKFEAWVMGSPVLPIECTWAEAGDGLLLHSDCSAVLTGRPMSEVRLLVEGWLFLPTMTLTNPNYQE